MARAVNMTLSNKTLLHLPLHNWKLSQDLPCDPPTWANLRMCTLHCLGPIGHQRVHLVHLRMAQAVQHLKGFQTTQRVQVPM